MLLLGLGLALFFAIHLVPTAPAVRDGLTARFGEGAYKGLFSVVSLLGFALIVYGYQKLQLHPGKNPILWTPPPGMKLSISDSGQVTDAGYSTGMPQALRMWSDWCAVDEDLAA